MKKAIFLITTIFILIFGITDSARAITVRSGHPRLFINSDNLSTLRARAAGANVTQYKAILSYCNTYWSTTPTSTFGFYDTHYDTAYLRYALIYALGDLTSLDPTINYVGHPLSEYGDRAIAGMLQIVAAYPSYGATSLIHVRFMSMAYDWVYSRMTASQRTQIYNWMYVIVTSKDNGETPTIDGLTGTHRGYRFVNTPVSFYMGLAMAGDGHNDLLMTTYVNFISTYLSTCKALVHMSGNDGGTASGQGYGQYTYAGAYYTATMPFDFISMVTATDLTAGDTFGTYPYIQNFPRWIIYGVTPDPNGRTSKFTEKFAISKWNDSQSNHWDIQIDGNTGKVNPALMFAFMADAQAWKLLGDNTTAGVIMWFIKTKCEVSYISSTYDILLNDPTIIEVSPSSAVWPTSKAFGWDSTNHDLYRNPTTFGDNNNKGGMGEVFMMSSWTDSDRTYSGFRAFPYWYFGHQHHDSLTFNIFKNEVLIDDATGKYYPHYEGTNIDGIAAGFPHHWNVYKRGMNSNIPLIADPNEVVKDASSASGPHDYKDGGPRTTIDGNNYWGDVVPYGTYDWGGLKSYHNTADFTFASGDATPGYNSSYHGRTYLTSGASPKTNLVQRDYVYLKSSSGDNDYFVQFDRIHATTNTFRKTNLLHSAGEPLLYSTGSPAAETQVYGDATKGLWYSDNTNEINITGIENSAKMFVRILLPTSPRVYKHGGRITTTLATGINDTDGATSPATVEVVLTDSSGFSATPTVIVDAYDASTGGEAFKCGGNNTGTNTLTGCIRGYRYWRSAHNTPVAHSIGETVEESYEFLVKQVDDGSWHSYPYHFSDSYTDPTYTADPVESRTWGLRIESTVDESITNFLNVFWPTANMSATVMADTTLLTGTTYDAAAGMKGVLIADSVNQWVAMFKTTEDNQSACVYSVSYAGSAKHLISGLKKGRYNVYKNHVLLTSYVNVENTVYFEDTAGGGGAFEVRKAYIVDDFTFYSIPTTMYYEDGSSFSGVPAKATAFVDHVLQTKITRITDLTTEVPGQKVIYGGYSKHYCENSDGTYLALQNGLADSTWYLYTGPNHATPYQYVRTLPTTFTGITGTNKDPDIRWGASADILYSTKEMKLMQYNVTTQEVTTVHDFASDYSAPTTSWRRLWTKEEGDGSDDRRYFVFYMDEYLDAENHSLGSHAVRMVVWDTQTNSTVSTLGVGDANEAYWVECNNIQMSPSGNYVWGAECYGGGGVKTWPRALNAAPVANTKCQGHADATYDSNGNEVIICGYTNYSYSGAGTWAKMIKMSDGTETWLAPLDQGGAGYHVAAKASGSTPGWTIISTYVPTYPDTPNNWAEYAILLMEVKAVSGAGSATTAHSRIWRVGNTRIKYVSYADGDFAQFNKSGTRIYFGSGWGTSWHDTGSIHEAYVVDLPSTWYADFSTGEVSEIPPVTVTAPTTAPTLTSPASGATGQSTTPNLSWSRIANIDFYNLQVVTRSGAACDTTDFPVDTGDPLYVVLGTNIQCTTSSCTYAVPDGRLLSSTSYCWRVQGTNANVGGGPGPWATSRSFTTQAAGIPNPPTLVSPYVGEMGVASPITFSWTAASGTPSLSYRLQVSSSSSFSTTVTCNGSSSCSGIAETSITPTLGTMTAGTMYYWRVYATGSGGESGTASVGYFYTYGDIPAPPAPTLVGVYNGTIKYLNHATDVPYDVRLRFSTYLNTQYSYVVQVSTSGTFDTITWTSSGSGGSTAWTYMNAGTLAQGTTYYWRMQASNVGGSSSWSAVWDFQTSGSTPTPEPPTCTSITRNDSSPTAVQQVSWLVTFSQPVISVTIDSFILTTTGVIGASITGVTGSGTTWYVTTSTGVGDGTLGLNLYDDDRITDVTGVSPLGGVGNGNGNKTGEVYTISKNPAVGKGKFTKGAESGQAISYDGGSLIIDFSE